MTDTLPHRVDHPAYPCPKCGQKEHMTVHLEWVVWKCGWRQRIPVLPNNGAPHQRRYISENNSRRKGA